MFLTAKDLEDIKAFLNRGVTTPSIQEHIDEGGEIVLEYSNGLPFVKWFKNQTFHRTNGPALQRDSHYHWYREGVIHREGGPAREFIEFGENHKEWIQHGKHHREDGPAMVSASRREWRQNGILHRTDGPAVEYVHEKTGLLDNKLWFQNGKAFREDGPTIETPEWNAWLNQEDLYHKEDGPAKVFTNGRKEWWLNGERHRADGPAVVCANGSCKYYVFDRYAKSQEHVDFVLGKITEEPKEPVAFRP